MSSSQTTCCLAAVLFALPAGAQWPGSAVTNLAIGDGSGNQTLAKIAATSDGGCYVAWFDWGIPATTLGLRAQRLDAAGNEQWPHGGVLVSGLMQTNLIGSWDMVCDSADHCVLVFADAQFGADRDVFACRVTPSGTHLWGANGIALSSNTTADDSPRVCEAHDGDLVVVWPNTTTNAVRIQRISPAGTLRFPGDGHVIPSAATPRVVAGAPGTGDVIVHFVGTTPIPGLGNALLAQKFDAIGNPLWSGPRTVGHAASSAGGETKVVADGAGGAVFAWANPYTVRVQRVDGSGTDQFAQYGVAVSTSSDPQTLPAIAWVPSQQSVLVAWIERAAGWTQWGVCAQQLGPTGASLWGPTGVPVLPPSPRAKHDLVASRLRAHAANDGMMIGVLVSNGVGIQDNLHVAGLTSSGASAFPAVLASTAGSAKSRLEVTTTASGTQVLAWADERNGNSDIYAAAVDARGAIGVSLGTATIGGCGVNLAGSLTVHGRPAVGTSLTWELTNPLATQAPGSLGLFFVGTGALGFPCGVPIPGLGMAGPGAPGELILDVNQPHAGLFAGTWAPPAPVALTFPVPFSPGLVGAVLYVQGLMLDVAPGALVPLGLANGARIVVGS